MLVVRLGFGVVSGLLIMQVCVMFVACVHVAVVAGFGICLVVVIDCMFNGLYVVYLSVGVLGGMLVSENWVFDFFGCDFNIGEGMFVMVECVVEEVGFLKQ